MIYAVHICGCILNISYYYATACCHHCCCSACSGDLRARAEAVEQQLRDMLRAVMTSEMTAQEADLLAQAAQLQKQLDRKDGVLQGLREEAAHIAAEKAAAAAKQQQSNKEVLLAASGPSRHRLC